MKTFEDKIRQVIREHEKKSKQEVTEVRAYKKRETGFGKKEEIVVNYYTK